MRGVPQKFGELSFFVSNSHIWASNNFDVEKIVKSYLDILPLQIQTV